MTYTKKEMRKMGTDIFIYKRCKKCRHMNQFELYRSDEGRPFDINNEKYWKLLNTVMHEDIAEARKRFRAMNHAEQVRAFEEDCYNPYSPKEIITTEMMEKAFIAAEYKIVDDGAFNFLHCEKCDEPLMFYIYSV